MSSPTAHPLAPEHLPVYVAAADGSDYLFTFMAYFTGGLILLIGVAYLTLHAVPEKIAHESSHSQMQVVGILALLALFTHNNIFWVIAILVAAFRPPDFITPITSIARSLAAIAGRDPEPDLARAASVGHGHDTHDDAAQVVDVTPVEPAVAPAASAQDADTKEER